MKKLKFAYIPLLCLACSEVKSSAVNTNGMYANFNLNVNDSVVEASASFRVGNAFSNTYVELDQEDTVEVSNSSESLTLTHSSLFNAHVYNGNFTETAPDTEYTFSLNRPAETSAPNSTVTLPQDIILTAPMASNNYSLSSGSAIEVKWENRSDDMVNVSITGDCIDSFSSGDIADSAAFTIVGSDITPEEPVGDCDATIEVTRFRTGTVDGAYSGGSIKANQTATVQLQIDP